MTEHDKNLLRQAKALHHTDWYVAGDLAEQADSPETARELRRIEGSLYRTGEFLADLPWSL